MRVSELDNDHTKVQKTQLKQYLLNLAPAIIKVVDSFNAI